jgi:hypothetical protein
MFENRSVYLFWVGFFYQVKILPWGVHPQPEYIEGGITVLLARKSKKDENGIWEVSHKNLQNAFQREREFWNNRKETKMEWYGI